MKHSASLQGTDLTAEQLALFRRAALILTSSLELEDALENAISACLPALGDFGFFDVILGDAVRRTARAHQNPDLEAFLKKTSWSRQERMDINLCALSTGEEVLHADTDDAWYSRAFGEGPRALDFRSMLTVPVRHSDELIGSLTLFMAESGRNHNENDLRFAAELAGLAAPVVVNARLLAQQREAQDLLRLSEERLRLATDAGKIGIWDWDIRRNTVAWSDRVYELHDIPFGQFSGRLEDSAALVYPEDRDTINHKLSAALEAGDVFTAEFRTPLRDGTLRWLSTHASIERDVDGKAVRLVGSTIDITEQKIKQARLNAVNEDLEHRVISSESERDRIWRMSKDILAVASFTGYFISVSPSFTSILGWNDEEALTTPFMQLVHPDQHHDFSKQLALLAEGIVLNEYESRSLHKDGTYRWISWTIVPEGGLLYGVGRDVTDLRRQREQILGASEMRLQLALRVGGMGVWDWDMVHGKVTWWPGMAALHGLPPGTTLGRVQDYLQHVHPEDHALASRSLGSKVPQEAGRSMEYRVVWPDGSIHWLEARAEVFYDEAGKPIQMAGVCVDITHRKVNERNLRFLARASAELAELVDHKETLARVAQLAVPSFADWCAVDLLDGDGALKRVAVAHVDPVKVKLGHELFERYPPDPAAQGGTWQVIRSGEAALVPEISEQMLNTSIKDANYLRIIKELGLRSYIGAPLKVRGKTLGVLTFISAESRRIYGDHDIALAEDIGRRAAVAIENSILYRTLKEADQRKDDFLAMLAHELRNPLAPIRAAADLLALPLAQEQIRKTGDVISRQVQHMTGLVDDLLDVSRVTRGQVVIEKAPVNLSLVATAAIEQVRPLIEKQQHKLTVEIGSGALLVEGDEKRLIQIIANLLNNAAKYTPPNGHIGLEIDAVKDTVELRVIDDGIGMSPDLLATAFELFVQGKRSADRAQGGLGLGLALVKSMVELHGGSVRAYSEGRNRGSKFVIRLPKLASTVAVPDRSGNGHATRKSSEERRILVVDDNADAAAMLVLFLQTVGHEVDVAYHPSDALKQLARQRFDIVLLDIGLPDMDGYELARCIREMPAGKSVLLVAVSGYGQSHDRQAAVASGIDHYLVKPVDTSALTMLLDTAETAAL